MSSGRRWLFAITMLLHVVATLALVLLLRETRAMGGFCIIAGALMCCAAVPAQPGRPIALYAAFGASLAYAFWLAVGAINQGGYIALLPALLLGIGAAWLLQAPDWPSVTFSAVAGLFCIALAVYGYQHRGKFLEIDERTMRHSLLTTVVVLGVGVVYLTVGFLEIRFRPRRKKKKRLVGTYSGLPSACTRE
jgi:hypothetical protein